MPRLPSAKAAESKGAAFLSPAQVLDVTDSPGRPCELPAALLHSELISGDEGPCGQLVPSAAVRWTVPSARGEPSQDGWASASARFMLGKKREGASLLQLDSGALGVKARNVFYFGCSRATTDQLPRPWRPSLQAPVRML